MHSTGRIGKAGGKGRHVGWYCLALAAITCYLRARDGHANETNFTLLEYIFLALAGGRSTVERVLVSRVGKTRQHGSISN